MTPKKKTTGPVWVRRRLIDGKVYNVLPNGRTGKAVKPYYDPIKANSPAAYEPDEDTPIMTMRELKQFKRVNPLAGPLAKTTARVKARKKAADDVAALRKGLRMSQAVFAEVFKLSVATVRDWESRRRKPDGPARVLLQVIARDPEAVKRALG